MSVHTLLTSVDVGPRTCWCPGHIHVTVLLDGGFSVCMYVYLCPLSLVI